MIAAISSHRTFTKPHFVNATVEQVYYDRAQEVNKEIQRRFVLGFEYLLAARGESVNSAINTLRGRGFIINRSTLNRWKRGIITNFNSFQFNFLAQYVGYPDFIALINANPAGIE